MVVVLLSYYYFQLLPLKNLFLLHNHSTMNRFLLVFFFVLTLANISYGQCSSGFSQIKVELLTDQYPNETNWKIYDANNNVVLQSSANMNPLTYYFDSICVPNNTCYFFKITDVAGDGICCAYGHGHFKVYYNNILVKQDSSFGLQSSIYVGCPPGWNCINALTATLGTYTAPLPNTWYQFVPSNTGMYTVSTCSQGNTCDTKLWMYDYCNNLQYSNTNAATIYYADNSCGIDAYFNAYLLANHSYYIRVGDANSSCVGTPIHWELSYNSSIVGCLDTNACNFNPFTTISNPSSCIYYPNALCPTGSDLIVDSQRLSSTVMMDTLSSSNVCTIREGCMNGYGIRQLIRFDTKIENIGATDFFAGVPPASSTAYSSIFEWDQCHGHWHFENYAEYLLSDSLNNFIPIGYKNGFCIMDISCSTGSPKYGCNNMGITAGCSDIYARNLDCQWVDITDIPDGDYKLIMRVNWLPRPDFYGRYEVSYTNNWARACIHIYHDTAGHRAVDVLPNCAPYLDCNGVVNGLSVKDCSGLCGGTRKVGDLNLDSLRNTVDVTNYMLGSIDYSLPANKCNDLNADGKINVTDAALLYDCSKHGPGSIPMGHSHEPCRFPDKIKNPFQHAQFSLGNIDYIAQTLDIFITNDNAKVLGYQLKLSGLKISQVQNTILNFTPEIHFKPTGEIIVLTNNEMPILKNQVPTLAIRLQYSSIDTNKVCIDSVIAVVNDAYEEIVASAIDSICVTAIPTPNNIVTPENGKAHSLFPNPFNQSTTLYINDLHGEAYDLSVIDVYGRIVREYRSVKSGYLIIERGELSSGLYFLKAKSNQWMFKEKMLIE